MKTAIQLAVGALALTLGARGAAAQEPMPEEEGFFGKPAFVLMPGAVILPVLSGYGPGEAGDTKAYFNARFMTVVPTRLPWFQLLAGTQFLVNGPRRGSTTLTRGARLNQPNIFYGAIIPFAPLTAATGGWFSLSINPLGVYSAGGGSDPQENAYGHDFVIEGALVANVGQKMFTNTAFFSSTSVYVLLDQFLTNRPELPNGDKDYWSPILLTGVTIPVGR